MIRRRILLLSLLFGAIALFGYGLQRWPPSFTKRPYVDSAGRNRIERRLVFERGTEDKDRIFGAVDFIAAALLFWTGPYLRYGWTPRQVRLLEVPEGRSPGEDALDVLIVSACVLGGSASGLLGVAAIINLFR